MTVKNAAAGSFMHNLLREGTTTINTQITVTAATGPNRATLHLQGFGGTPLTLSQPGFVRHTPSTLYAITDDDTSRDCVILDADSFGLPAEFEDATPLFVGIAEVLPGLADCVLVVSRTRTYRAGTTVASGTASDADAILGPSAGVSIDRVVWVGALAGMTRAAGAWNWTNARFIDGKYL